MFGRFGPEARRAIALAEDRARALGRPAVGPEHLLLALADGGGVLERGGLGADRLHAELLERADGDDVPPAPPRAPVRDLPLHLREVFRAAFRHAAARGDPEVLPMHLALALLADPPGEITAVLRRLGLGAPDLHRVVVDAMAEGDVAASRAGVRHHVVELPRQADEPGRKVSVSAGRPVERAAR